MDVWSNPFTQADIDEYEKLRKEKDLPSVTRIKPLPKQGEST
jgi:hypothetical protein